MILDCGYHELESIEVRTPTVGDVFECYEVRFGEERPHRSFRVSTAEVSLCEMKYINKFRTLS